MSWQGEMTTIVRQLIYDVDSTNYTYSDDRLETTILVAAQLVSTEIDFEENYIIDVEQCTLSPDPTDPTTLLASADKDDGFINLVSLKAACIIMGSEMKTQGLNAIRVSDGPSSVDCTAAANYIKYLHDHSCKQYEDFKFNYSTGSNTVGKAILSPYSPGSDVVQRSYDYVRGYFR
jgi:hypothetical protein